MPQPHSFYLGPGKQRLLASSWTDLATAAASGALDETQWVELKEAIPATIKPANLELAKDLASLSVDGGVLIVGISDAGGTAGQLVGTEVAGLVDRIAQVAASRASPPLQVSAQVFAKPDHPGHGALIITVPASLGAPHMVDGSYWG